MAQRKSGQKWIAKNRAPRVQIEYDVEVYGSEKKVQIPFVMGVMADLSGKSEEPQPDIADRKFTEIDFDNFDARMKAIQLDFGDKWLEVALRFTAFTPGISCSIVGTTNLDHIKKNIDIVNKGALSIDIVEKIRDAFKKHDNNWNGCL